MQNKQLLSKNKEEIYMDKNFVHLHVHSDYSLQRSIASVKTLVERAEELGMPHLALTDMGNMPK